MSRMNRRRFTWIATSGVASAALVACSGEAVEEDLTPTRISDVEGAPPTLAPNATPFESDAADGGAEEDAPEEETGAQEGPQTHTVEMTDELIFDPAELTINVGDTVTWITTGVIPHTSTCDPEEAQNPEEHVQLPDGAETWNSGVVNQDEEFSHTLEVAGEYTYFCIPHEAVGMVGYITVQEGGAAGAGEEDEAAAEEDGGEEATPAEGADAAEGGGGTEPITLEAIDPFDWSMTEFEASPGQTIHVVNTGSLQHDFTVDDWGIQTDLLNGGEEADVAVPDDAEVGAEVVFYCSVPGHRESGMEGTITVVEA